MQISHCNETRFRQLDAKNAFSQPCPQRIFLLEKEDRKETLKMTSKSLLGVLFLSTCNYDIMKKRKTIVALFERKRYIYEIYQSVVFLRSTQEQRKQVSYYLCLHCRCRKRKNLHSNEHYHRLNQHKVLL